MTAPRLVLVHGTRVSHTQWNLEPYRRELAGLEVVTPDLPGHGSRVGERFTTEAAVAVIAAAVESGAPGAPVVLAGHSLGGYMAMAYAAQHPERLAGLALVGATAVPGGPGAAAYRAFAALIPRVGPERMARVSNSVLTRLAGPEVVAAVLSGGDSYAATADAWDAVLAGGRPEQLRSVRCPVLLVSGQFDQLGVHAERFAAQCREPQVVRVPRATHLLPMTHPEVLAKLLARFTARCAARAGSGDERAT